MRDRKQEEEEEGLLKADAVNEEDPERDRATQVEKTWRRTGKVIQGSGGRCIQS